ASSSTSARHRSREGSRSASFGTTEHRRSASLCLDPDRLGDADSSDPAWRAVPTWCVRPSPPRPHRPTDTRCSPNDGTRPRGAARKPTTEDAVAWASGQSGTPRTEARSGTERGERDAWPQIALVLADHDTRDRACPPKSEALLRHQPPHSPPVLSSP